MQNKNVNRLYITAIAVKISLVIFAVVFTNIGFYKPTDDYLLFSKFNWNSLLEIFFNFDSGWYKVIATNGYAHIPEADLQGWNHPELHFAFFPLYPFCVGLIMKVTGLTFVASGLIFNIIILYFVVRYFYLFLLQMKLNESVAFRIVILFLLFPFTLHFYFLYTESLFFTLMIASFLFLSKKQWWQFAISSSLLVLTRPNGIFLMLPFILFMLEQEGTISFDSIKRALKTTRYYIVLVMPFVFFLWLVYQKQITGKYFAFKFAQETGWYKTFVFPLWELFKNGKPLDQFISIYTTAFMLVSVIMWRKWKLSIQTLVWINILLPLSAGSTTSMTRYLSILFPYHTALGETGFAKKHFKYIVLVFIIFQIICFKFWIEDHSLMY